MTTHTVTPADELEIIHLLADGTRTPAQVARRIGVAWLIVYEVAKKHGWPHLGSLADSAEALRKKLGPKEPGAELERRRKIKALEAKIAELKAERPRATSGAPRQTGDSKVVRAWADANGVECSRYGYIPKAVRAAYEEAQR